MLRLFNEAEPINEILRRLSISRNSVNNLSSASKTTLMRRRRFYPPRSAMDRIKPSMPDDVMKTCCSIKGYTT